MFRNLFGTVDERARFQTKAGDGMNAVKRLVLLFSIGLPVPLATAQVSAQQKPDGLAPAKEGSSRISADALRLELEEFKQSAARYRIATDNERPKDLVLTKEPVLRWTNPLTSWRRISGMCSPNFRR